MSKYLTKGKGIKVITHWGEEGEIIATYRHPRGGARYFRIRLGPAHFTDLPRGKFEYVDFVIPFKTIHKLFHDTWAF